MISEFPLRIRFCLLLGCLLEKPQITGLKSTSVRDWLDVRLEAVRKDPPDLSDAR